MSVYQVEEYYLSLDKSQLNMTGDDMVFEFISDNHGSDFNYDGEYLTIDGFDSEGAAEQFEEDLIKEFPPVK